eukprot:1510488-Amphidinium_carterae.2
MPFQSILAAYSAATLGIVLRLETGSLVLLLKMLGYLEPSVDTFNAYDLGFSKCLKAPEMGQFTNQFAVCLILHDFCLFGGLRCNISSKIIEPIQSRWLPSAKMLAE